MSDFIKDDSFEVEKTKDYKLSIQVNLDGFSFLISHPVQKRIVAFKSTSLLISSEILLARRLKEWLENEELLKRQFQSVQVFIFTENFTIVPDEFFENERQKILTSVLFEKKPNNHFEENKIEGFSSYLFFSIQQDVFNVVNHFFSKNIEIIHPVTQLIQTPVESDNRNSAIILPSKKFFYLVILSKGRLLLANCFQSLHPSDLIYNIINSFQQLEISRSNTNLYLGGSFNQNNEIKELIRPYFENISHLNKLSSQTNPVIINNSIQHYLTLI